MFSCSGGGAGESGRNRSGRELIPMTNIPNVRYGPLGCGAMRDPVGYPRFDGFDGACQVFYGGRSGRDPIDTRTLSEAAQGLVCLIYLRA